MAFINENPLFSVNGKVGRYVVRKFNGKKVIALRPAHYKKTGSKKALVNQNKFAAVSNLAKVVNSSPLLYGIWKSSRLKGFSPYHKIIKANMKHTTEDGLSVFNIIVPPPQSNFIDDVSLQNNFLVCKLHNIDKLTQSIKNGRLHLIIVWSFSKLSKSKVVKHNVKLGSYSFALSGNSVASGYQILIEKDVVAQIKNSTRCVFFVAMIWYSSKKLEWSACYAKVI